jgi:hypothetical protein
MADVWALKHVRGMATVHVYDNEEAASKEFIRHVDDIRARERCPKEIRQRKINPVREYIPGQIDDNGPIIGQYFFVFQNEFVEYRKQKLLTSA